MSEGNSNVPSFLSQIPWYSKDEGSKISLKKAKPVKASVSDVSSKGAKVVHNELKFRKGACTNCGSISHPTKDCCERPRKIGAKYSGKIVNYDEIHQESNLDYDSKHDRWKDYDPSSYKEVMSEYQRLEEAKKKRKLEILQTKYYEGEEVDLSDGEKNEEYRYSVMTNNIDPRTKTIGFNNRARDDPVCYISNIDPEVNNYDGKSRSFKDVPTGTDPQDQLYRDSWVKVNGEMRKMIDQEQFIQNLNDKGNDLHSLANPSHAEILFNLYRNDKKTKVSQSQQVLLDKYGTQDYSDI